jgi:hypothetical protein
MEALFISHFFPQYAKVVWTYAAVLYWSTMYLTHHYLIDVVGGACLATAFFYLFLPDDLKGPAAFVPPRNFTVLSPTAYNGNGNNNNNTALPLHMHNGTTTKSRNKYAIYDLEDPRARLSHGALAAAEMSDEDYCEDEYELESPVSPTPGPRDVMDFAAQQQQQPQPQQSLLQHQPQQIPLPAPDSSVPLLAQMPSPLPPIKSKQRTRKHGAGGGGGAGGRGHRHTASIASLIREEERTEEDGWSPVVDGFAIGPPVRGRV